MYKVQVRFSSVSEPFQVRSLRPPSNSPEGEGLKIVLQAIDQSRGNNKAFEPTIYMFHLIYSLHY